MEPRAQIIKDREGHERVILDLADFQALIDACQVVEHGEVDVKEIVEALAKVLDEPHDESIDLDDFLRDYDALHRRG